MKRLFFLLTLLFPALVSAQEDKLGLFPFFTMGENIADVWVNPSSRKTAGADGQVVVDGDRFVTSGNGKEIQFWGVNTCFSMNFPDKDDAVRYAKRMASFGINAVRLHHMDASEIWGKNFSMDMTAIDPEKLDRLDWYIYQLKQNGIYVNINLHVSRKFDKQNGFTGYEGRPKQDKGLDNFEPRMIEFQKKYAKDLLSHVNPYTKMSYLEDPCVAVIEINNENSVVASWFWGQLDTLPEEYEATFQKLWNVWLAKKYASTAEVRKAWNFKTFEKEKNIVPDDGTFNAPLDAKAWNMENGSGSVASAKSQDGVLRIDVEKLGTISWNPQFYFRDFPVKGGAPYTLKFRARALNHDALTLHTGLRQNHAEWGDLSFSTEFEVGKEWKEFTFTFITLMDDEKARLSFNGFEPGAFEFDDISLCLGGNIGIPESEKLEDASIRIMYRNRESGRSTSEARADFTNFLIDLEQKYWLEMYHYVKDELGAKAPVTGTQLNYGAHYSQARLDYCDIHAYWNHPSFPGRPWDGGNWRLGNTAVANVLGCGHSRITNLANNRVLGKPYTVSEYNHPYPNLYGAEGFPMISSMAGFQHWNGIFIFAWSHSKDFSPEETPSFFDIKGNSVQLVHMAACYNMFVRGDVQHANSVKNAKKVVYEVGEQEERDLYAQAKNSYSRSLAPIGFLNWNPLLTSVGIRLKDLGLKNPETDGVKAFVSPEEPEVPAKTVSNTGELLWNGEIEHHGCYMVDSPKTKVFTGFIQGRSFEYGNGMKIEFGKTLLDWATVSFTQTRENHWLLAATGLQKNSDCVLGLYDPDEVKDTPVEEYPNLIDKQITFCKKRGHAPLMCEGIPAVITIPAAKNVTVKYYPLDGNAKRMQELTAQRVDDSRVELKISREYKTLWYEVVFEKN